MKHFPILQTGTYEDTRRRRGTTKNTRKGGSGRGSEGSLKPRREIVAAQVSFFETKPDVCVDTEPPGADETWDSTAAVSFSAKVAASKRAHFYIFYQKAAKTRLAGRVFTESEPRTDGLAPEVNPER